MIIREAVFIHAALETVWEVFSEIENWAEWNPVCRQCRFETGNALATGACISFELNPIVLPMRISPVVTNCEAGRSVTWTGSKFGIYATHTFNFEAASGGVRLESIERFSGLMLLPARWIGVPKRLHGLTRRLLDAVKDASENRVEEAE